jgi:hypothetical protein
VKRPQLRLYDLLICTLADLYDTLVVLLAGFGNPQYVLSGGHVGQYYPPRTPDAGLSLVVDIHLRVGRPQNDETRNTRAFALLDTLGRIL